MKLIITLAIALSITTVYAQKTTYTVNETTKTVVIYHNNSSVPADHFTQQENPILYAFVARLKEIVIDLNPNYNYREPRKSYPTL